MPREEWEERAGELVLKESMTFDAAALHPHSDLLKFPQTCQMWRTECVICVSGILSLQFPLNKNGIHSRMHERVHKHTHTMVQGYTASRRGVIQAWLVSWQSF